MTSFALIRLILEGQQMRLTFVIVQVKEVAPRSVNSPAGGGI